MSAQSEQEARGYWLDRLADAGEVASFVEDREDYAFMMRATGAIFAYDREKREFVSLFDRRPYTLHAERAARLPPRGDTKCLTAEEVELPCFECELPGFDKSRHTSPRYGYSKEWQQFVQQRRTPVTATMPLQPSVSAPSSLTLRQSSSDTTEASSRQFESRTASISAAVVRPEAVIVRTQSPPAVQTSSSEALPCSVTLRSPAVPPRATTLEVVTSSAVTPAAPSMITTAAPLVLPPISSLLALLPAAATTAAAAILLSPTLPVESPGTALTTAMEACAAVDPLQFSASQRAIQAGPAQTQSAAAVETSALRSSIKISSSAPTPEVPSTPASAYCSAASVQRDDDMLNPAVLGLLPYSPSGRLEGLTTGASPIFAVPRAPLQFTGPVSVETIDLTTPSTEQTYSETLEERAYRNQAEFDILTQLVAALKPLTHRENGVPMVDMRLLYRYMYQAGLQPTGMHCIDLKEWFQIVSETGNHLIAMDLQGFNSLIKRCAQAAYPVVTHYKQNDLSFAEVSNMAHYYVTGAAELCGRTVGETFKPTSQAASSSQAALPPQMTMEEMQRLLHEIQAAMQHMTGAAFDPALLTHSAAFPAPAPVIDPHMESDLSAPAFHTPVETPSAATPEVTPMPASRDLSRFVHTDVTPPPKEPETRYSVSLPRPRADPSTTRPKSPVPTAPRARSPLVARPSTPASATRSHTSGNTSRHSRRSSRFESRKRSHSKAPVPKSAKWLRKLKRQNEARSSGAASSSKAATPPSGERPTRPKRAAASVATAQIRSAREAQEHEDSGDHEEAIEATDEYVPEADLTASDADEYVVSAAADPDVEITGFDEPPEAVTASTEEALRSVSSARRASESARRKSRKHRHRHHREKEPEAAEPEDVGVNEVDAWRLPKLTEEQLKAVPPVAHREMTALMYRGKVESLKTQITSPLSKLFGAELKRATRHAAAIANALAELDKSFSRAELQQLRAATTWKVLMVMPDQAFQVPGRRWTTPLERANYNLLRCFGSGLISMARIRDRFEKTVANASAAWLEADESHRLSPSDIWLRFRCFSDGLGGFSESTRLLEGRTPTVISTDGLANASAVVSLMSAYSLTTTGAEGVIIHFELANGGLYRLSKFARRFATWTLGIEDFALLAMDLASECRAKFEGTHIDYAFSHAAPQTKVDFYLCSKTYDYTSEGCLIEWSYNEEVESRFARCTTSQAIGNQEASWRKKHPELRVPFVLEYGGLCEGFGAGGTARVYRPEVVQAFVRRFKELAADAEWSTNEDPQPASPYTPSYLDHSFNPARHEENLALCGSTRTSDMLDFTPFQREAGVFQFGLDDAVIAVFRIGAAAKSVGVLAPSLLNLMLFNAYGFPLMFRSSDGPEVVHRPIGVETFPGCSSEEMEKPEIRKAILKFVGANNVLVGFNIGWLLTAVDLAMPASRVVDLGLEVPYQRFCRLLSVKAPHLTKYDGILNCRQRIPFDRRWPAVLYADCIDLYADGMDSVVREGYYTAAVWRCVGKKIVGLRMRPEVYRLKTSYVIGCGDVISEEETAILRQPSYPCDRLCDDGSIRRVDSMQVDTPADLFKMCADPEWPTAAPYPVTYSAAFDEFRTFTKLCIALSTAIDLCATSVADEVDLPLSDTFGPPAERNQLAVNIALASPRIHSNPELTVAWINNHRAFTIRELRGITPSYFEISESPMAKRLFSSFIDLGRQVLMQEAKASVALRLAEHDDQRDTEADAHDNDDNEAATSTTSSGTVLPRRYQPPASSASAFVASPQVAESASTSSARLTIASQSHDDEDDNEPLVRRETRTRKRVRPALSPEIIDDSDSTPEPTPAKSASASKPKSAAKAKSLSGSPRKTPARASTPSPAKSGAGVTTRAAERADASPARPPLPASGDA